MELKEPSHDSLEILSTSARQAKTTPAGYRSRHRASSVGRPKLLKMRCFAECGSVGPVGTAKLLDWIDQDMPTDMLSLKGFRYRRGIIAYAVWAYHCFPMSTVDVVDLLAARGVIVSREAIRLWIIRFGRHFADCIR